MKRKNFKISWDGHTEIAHAYNSAQRKVEAIIREIARNEDTHYYLVAKNSIKDKNMMDTISATRTWESKNGKKIMFTIERE